LLLKLSKEYILEIEINRIKKEDFLKLKEENIMFITNPGRMGDEDGSTFIVKQDNEFIIYRISGWLYGNEDDGISLDDVLKQFPKWHDAWDNSNNEEYKGKYKYLYMGFGNGLSVDNSMFNEFKPYLDKKALKYLEGKDDKESLKYSAIFNTWKEAFIDMINNRK